MREHLNDRPCSVCEFHTDMGCSQWECVFEQEPCEDCISRQATKDALYAALIELKINGLHAPIKKAWEIVDNKLEGLPSVTPKEPKTGQEINGDYISREKTLEKFCDYVGSGMSMNDFDALYDIVLKMPSIQPKTEQEPKFIAKADGTIEQIKDCEDCLFKREWEKIDKYKAESEGV